MSDDNGCLPIIIGFIIIFLIIFGTNTCSSGTWNYGECPKCDVRYELRGVSKGLKYYSCPGCGKEVRRY